MASSIEILEEPLVGIAVPVYQGAAFLRECLDSIRAQTYVRWEAVVADNKSTDGTAAISDEYARRDRRIHLLAYQDFVGQAANYNRALASLSPECKYWKIVEADNWIYPECLERMVRLSEKDDETVVVGSYYLLGDQVAGNGLCYQQSVVDGRKVGRMHLLESQFFFGTPTAVLYRAGSLRGEVVFDPDALHGDTELCYRLLKHGKFGFVHQVLSFIRQDNDGVSSREARFNPHLLSQVVCLRKYGSDYLSPEELKMALAFWESRYRRYLGWSWLRRRDREFWDFHERHYARAGGTIRRGSLIGPALLSLLDRCMSPKRTVERWMARNGRARWKPRGFAE